MLFSPPTDNAYGSLYEELNSLLTARDEESARSQLFEAMQRRTAAGALFFQAQHVQGRLAPEITTFWSLDFSGELNGDCPTEILKTVRKNIPDWLAAWLTSRKKPFWFFRYARFIPFSARLLIDSTAPPRKRQLADFVLTPYLNGVDRFFVLAGLHELANFELVQELSTLSMAYASRAVTDLTMQSTAAPRPDEVHLTERQLQCLQWMAAGKSLHEIAIITGMSYANVRYHLERAKRINGYATVQQLMVHAAQTHNLSPLGPEHTRTPGLPGNTET